jgi:hypothetical protein
MAGQTYTFSVFRAAIVCNFQSYALLLFIGLLGLESSSTPKWISNPFARNHVSRLPCLQWVARLMINPVAVSPRYKTK